MLYHLLTPYSESGGIFNVMNYATFRTGGALLTALLVFFVFGGRAIDWLKVKQGKGQPIRNDGPERHILEKTGTPTMGGVLVLGAISAGVLLWARLDNIVLWTVFLTTLGFGAIGFWDDFLKVSKLNTRGAPGAWRMILGLLIALAAACALDSSADPELRRQLALPFFKDLLINLSWFFFPFAMIVIVGSANAVNFTDGLDGLAIVPAMIAGLSLGIIAYMTGHAEFAKYLELHRAPGAGELIVYTGALLGAGLGFLWYNAPPARVFMGDTGSLALGGGLGSIAVATKHELVWMVIGGLFVLETVSVIIQVGYFKLSGGKRIFLMAPIHHHFEKKGWSEPTIVIRFWIIAVILALVGLSTLKLR